MRTSLFLNKIWNPRVPLCHKRSLENVAKCNKYSHMCRKPETQVLKSVTMRYSWRGECRPHSPVFSATLCFWQCSYTDGHPCSSVRCQHWLLQGPSDTVAAVTGEDRMHLRRWKGEKCPQANACLVLRGVLQEARLVPRQQRAAAAPYWPHRLTGTATDTSLAAHSNLRFSPTKLCHLTWTLPWNNNKPERQ